MFTQIIKQPAINWRDYAVCARHENPDVFFPVGDGPQARQDTAAAKAVCHTCPVAVECLQWALETRQDTGVWGGLSERERRRLHRRRPSYRRPDGLSATDYILLDRRAEFEELQAQGLDVREIARAMGTNVQTVNTVRERLAELGTTSEAVAA